MTLKDLLGALVGRERKSQTVPSRIRDFLDRELPCVQSGFSRWILSEPVYEPETPWGFSQILSLRLLQSYYQAGILMYYPASHNAKEAKKSNFLRLLPGLNIQVVPEIGPAAFYPKNKDAYFKVKMYQRVLGPLIWDSIITNRKVTPDDQQELREKLDLCRRLSVFTNHLLRNFKIVAGFFTHLNGVESGIPARALLDSQRPVVTLFGNPRFCRVHFQKPGPTNYLKIPRAMRKRELSSSRIISGYQKFYGHIKRGKIMNTDLRFSRFPSSKTITRTSRRQMVLVAMHCFTDAPHSLGQYIFKDWLEWFQTTLEVVKKNTATDWILKRHPASFLYMENFDYEKVEREVSSCRHIRCFFGNQKIPVSKFIESCDGVVSCGGSVALEFAAEGKPSLLAAEPPWSELGVSKIPRNLTEYRKELTRMGWCTPVTQKQQDLARRALYYYHVALPARANLFPMEPSFWRLKKKAEQSENYLKAIFQKDFLRNKKALFHRLKKVMNRKKQPPEELILLP